MTLIFATGKLLFWQAMHSWMSSGMTGTVPIESKYSHALSHGRLRPYHSHTFDWCSSSPSPHTQSLSEKVTPWMAGQ